MLDQNTDRMWNVIGAVLLGGLLIAGAVIMFNDTVFAEIGDTFNIFTKNAQYADATYIPKENSDFSNYGVGWKHRDTAASGWDDDVYNKEIFNGEYAYLKGPRDIFRAYDISTNSKARVVFRAKGKGQVKLRFGSSQSNIKTVDLEDNVDGYSTYEVDVFRSDVQNTQIIFIVGEGSELYLDRVDVWQVNK